MSQKDRRELLRQQVFESARQIVSDCGAAAVTIRRVADDVGYAAPVVYRHFADKEELIAEVLTDGYQRLNADLKVVVDSTDAVDVLHGIAQAYVGFAAQGPNIYNLMNGVGGTQLNSAVRYDAARGVVATTLEAVRKWAAGTSTSLPDPEAASDILWGAVHGITSIGLFADIGIPRARTLVAGVVDALEFAWMRGTAP